MLRYYPGYTLEKLRKLSRYQFHSLLQQIPIVEGMLRGEKTKKAPTTEELIEEAEKKGIIAPNE